MNKRFLISALIFVGSIFIDQVTKNFGKSLSTLYYNQGFIMGLYSGLPENIRVVALGFFAGILFYLYVFLHYIIPARAHILLYFLSLMMGGIYGNVIDKVIYGKTVDFIPVFYGGIHYVFNVADVFLWIGTLGIIVFLIFRDHLLFRRDSTRGQYIVWPLEQVKIGLNFCLVAFSFSLVAGIFSYTFFNAAIPSFIPGKEDMMDTYFITFLIITILFSLMAFVAGIIIGHKTVGPLYALELYIDNLIEGKDRKLSFRNGDNFRRLEAVAARLRTFITKTHSLQLPISETVPTEKEEGDSLPPELPPFPLSGPDDP